MSDLIMVTFYLLMGLVDGCMFWSTDTIISDSFFPSYEVITYPGLAVAMIAEFSFAYWILVKGAKEQQPVATEADDGLK